MARKPTVDPISSLMSTAYGFATLVLLGVVAPLNFFPSSYSLTFGTQLAAAVTMISAGIAVLYNGVDLRKLHWAETLFVFIFVIVAAAVNWWSQAQLYFDMYAPFTGIILWFMGSLALLILAYGDGVKWYPLDR